MIKRFLGRSKIEVSAVGMGCWAIGGPTQSPVSVGSMHFGWGDVDDAESIRALHAALTAGVTFFDTADVYGAGQSEHLLGQAVAGRRHEVVIATKFGLTFDSATRRMISPGYDASPEYIRRACEGSLRRLQTDYIDLYLFHLHDYDPAYADDVCDVLEKLVTAGKIRSYGWSTGNIEGARVFAERTHCTAVQDQCNVLEDHPAMLALCDEYNLASISRSPLAKGLLTGKFTAETRFPPNDLRQRGLNFQAASGAGLLKQVERLREVLTSDGRTLAQGALAWLLARSPRMIAIPGFKTVKQVEENAAAMEFGPLSQVQMQQVDALLGRTSDEMAGR